MKRPAMASTLPRYAVVWLQALIAAYLATLAIVSVSAADVRVARAVLWEVRSAAAQPSYVFGTVHAEDPRVLALPQPVRKRFDGARGVALELTLGPETMLSLAQAMYFTDERSLDKVAGAELYARVVELLADRGFPELAVRKMKPWAAATVLSTPKPKTGLVLDAQLYAQAREQGKLLFGLESAQEQVAHFDQLSIQDQVALLQEAIRTQHELPAMFDRILEAYLARDLDELVRISDEQTEQDNTGIARSLMAGLIDERNKTMVERMQPLIEEGNVFIAIGALHLPGEKGVLRLLEQRGYEVKPVY